MGDAFWTVKHYGEGKVFAIYFHSEDEMKLALDGTLPPYALGLREGEQAAACVAPFIESRTIACIHETAHPSYFPMSEKVIKSAWGTK